MIEIKNLTKKFGNRYLFSDMSLILETGKIYALTGASGSGKTTLLNILAKLESYEGGSIYYNGKALEKIKHQTFFRHDLGYLFQNFGLIEGETVEENLNLGLVGMKLKKSKRNDLQKKALKIVDLSYINLNEKIYTLSGGEAQRVALAKIVLKNPPLILADEPTAALDPKTSEEVMDKIIRLKNKDRIIIIATHNPIIWDLADEIIRIENKKNVEHIK